MRVATDRLAAVAVIGLEFRLVADTDLPQFDARVEGSREFFDEFAKVDALLGKKVEDDALATEQVFDIDELHLQPAVGDGFAGGVELATLVLVDFLDFPAVIGRQVSQDRAARRLAELGNGPRICQAQDVADFLAAVGADDRVLAAFVSDRTGRRELAEQARRAVADHICRSLRYGNGLGNIAHARRIVTDSLASASPSTDFRRATGRTALGVVTINGDSRIRFRESRMAGRSGNWVGQTLDGRYTVTALLGEGGMGYVFRANDTRLSGDVVIKVPRAELLTDAEFRQRFQDEVRALVRMNHPHVVKVTDTGKHEGLPYAVMQFLPGGSLDDRRPKTDDGRMKPMKARSLKDWLPAVASALDYIHAQGYVHRDIKPANILFDANRNAYISDFGVAKATFDTNRPNLTGAGMIVGTPEYVAPEIVNGKTFDGRADQYALGIMVYELISGMQPFAGSSPMAVLIKHISEKPKPLSLVRERTSPALSDAVMRAMAREPGERYPTCSDFAVAAVTAAEEATGNYGVPPPSTRTKSALSGLTPTQATTDKPRFMLYVAGALCAVLAFGLGLALTYRRAEPPSKGESPTNHVEPPFKPSVIPNEAKPNEAKPNEAKPNEAKPTPVPTPMPVKVESPRKAAAATLQTEVFQLGGLGAVEFVLIPAGTFRMGAPGATGPATPEHEVRITRPFYIATREVTVGQFRIFINADNYKTSAERGITVAEGWNATRGELERKAGYSWKNPGFPQKDDDPVVCVTKGDALTFVTWLRGMRDEFIDLPTEAQWERAARFGSGPFSGANVPAGLEGVANVADRSLAAALKVPRKTEGWNDGHAFTAPVGTFRKNSAGVFDMHGNVAEWCRDVQRDYSKPARPNPVGIDVFGAKHVVRGGSWAIPAADCAAYTRELIDDADTASCRIGFRLAIDTQR